MLPGPSKSVIRQPGGPWRRLNRRAYGLNKTMKARILCTRMGPSRDPTSIQRAGILVHTRNHNARAWLIVSCTQPLDSGRSILPVREIRLYHSGAVTPSTALSAWPLRAIAPRKGAITTWVTLCKVTRVAVRHNARPTAARSLATWPSTAVGARLVPPVGLAVPVGTMSSSGTISNGTIFCCKNPILQRPGQHSDAHPRLRSTALIVQTSTTQALTCLQNHSAPSAT